MNLITKIILFLALILFTFNANYAQTSFTRSDYITILKANGMVLENAWTGGFNSVQFSEIDMNLDGIKDLFVFDKTGNRVSTFINQGIANQVSYKYDPSYISYFPKDFSHWVLMRDYNCDGKMDIMAFHSAGIKAYKNTSTTQLSFVLDTIAIQSNYQPDGVASHLSLHVTPTDLPVIDDIDGDGDLDILTFGILFANHVEYHKNLSVETTGNCDGFIYELSNKCWGFFHENVANNNVTLFDTCQYNINNPQKPTGGNKHIGSTLLTLDVDANNSKDLVLGDVSFNNFMLLTNTDTSPNLDHSSMTQKDSLFPKNNNTTIPAQIEVFPAGFYLDVNNDSVKDLIASTFCNSGCNNNNNVWYYKNNGASNLPDFSYETDAFIQSSMIDIGEGAHPVFFDYNADGLLDLIVSNYGEYDASSTLFYQAGLWLYENVGTANTPSFQLITKDYANISTINLDLINSRPTLGLHPTFKDLDGDNDADMLLGDYNGRIHYFENTAGAGNTATFTLVTPDYLNIDVGNDATPLLYDLDKDGLDDLIVGKRLGTFSYYKNSGTSSAPNFTLVTDSLGKVSTKRYDGWSGKSNPMIIDSAGTTLLFSGSENGAIYKIGDIDGNLTGVFSVDSMFQNIWEGVNSVINITDINNDGLLDLTIGNQSGGLTYYDGNPMVDIEEMESFNEILLYPNPTSGIVKIDLGKNNLKNAHLQVVNILGKVMQSKAVNSHTTTLNLSNYSSGIYLVKFSNQNGSKVYKVVKE